MQPVLRARMGAAAALLCGLSTAAPAGEAVVLTLPQLDRISAGTANVFSTADAQAVGALGLTSTTSNSLIAGGVAPYPNQPGLTNDAGVATGTALAVGSNLAFSGASPASSNTSVTTGGSAAGNLVITSNMNHTVQGAGGVTFQAGFTFVYGAWVGF